MGRAVILGLKANIGPPDERDRGEWRTSCVALPSADDQIIQFRSSQQTCIHVAVRCGRAGPLPISIDQAASAAADLCDISVFPRILRYCCLEGVVSLANGSPPETVDR